jgi:RNA polymerase sigma factor (sigma-70 family)
MNNDWQLLQQYVREHSEDAFAEIVHRHVNLVYSAALRQVRSPQLAEEIAQSAFTDLARSARRLAPDTVLTAWLYQVTRRTAIDVVRREARRQLREQIATEMNTMNVTATDWTHIEPLLDEAMSALDETDRTAVLLRYFENQSLREVGQTLGTSDDTAQKRVSRAVERMREFFIKRGVSVGASGLTVIISANAVQAAPVGLAVTISTSAALVGSTLITAATATATKAIAMTTLQKALITATITAAVGTGIYEARQASRMRDQFQALQRQHTEESQQAQRERNDVSAKLTALRDENNRLKNNTTELQRLRGEVARLRNSERDLAKLPTTAQTAQPAANAAASAASQSNETDLPKDSWADAGFATPHAALQTRGWAVLNGNRERFKDSVFITDGARKILEDMFVQMAEASTDPNKAQYLQEILKSNLGVEEGFLMPMMAENRNKGYTGYRILSQQYQSADEMLLVVETSMVSAPAKKETLKFRRFGDDWKVVIDEGVLKSLR